MSSRDDLAHNVLPANTVAPTGARTTSTTGAAVDLKGANSATAVIHSATITDGVHTPKLQHDDDDGAGSPAGTWADVADEDLQNGPFAAIGSDEVQVVGYRGVKRHLRLVITVTGGPATGGVYSALIVKGHLDDAPPA